MTDHEDARSIEIDVGPQETPRRPFSSSRSIAALAKALAAAQGALRGAVRDGVNQHFGSRYADLAAVWDACREPLTANGLAVSQLPERVNGEVAIVTVLIHTSGEWIASPPFSTAIPRQDAQSVGSALTYLRRYALAAMVGVAPEDDDGEAAVGRTARQAEPPPPRRDLLEDLIPRKPIEAPLPGMPEKGKRKLSIKPVPPTGNGPEYVPPPPEQDATLQQHITEQERRELYRLCNLHGRSHGELLTWLKGRGVPNAFAIPLRLYDDACAWAAGG